MDLKVSALKAKIFKVIIVFYDRLYILFISPLYATKLKNYDSSH